MAWCWGDGGGGQDLLGRVCIPMGWEDAASLLSWDAPGEAGWPEASQESIRHPKHQAPKASGIPGKHQASKASGNQSIRHPAVAKSIWDGHISLGKHHPSNSPWAEENPCAADQPRCKRWEDKRPPAAATKGRSPKCRLAGAGNRFLGASPRYGACTCALGMPTGSSKPPQGCPALWEERGETGLATSSAGCSQHCQEALKQHQLLHVDFLVWKLPRRKRSWPVCSRAALPAPHRGSPSRLQPPAHAALPGLGRVHFLPKAGTSP